MGASSGIGGGSAIGEGSGAGTGSGNGAASLEGSTSRASGSSRSEMACGTGGGSGKRSSFSNEGGEYSAIFGKRG